MRLLRTFAVPIRSVATLLVCLLASLAAWGAGTADQASIEISRALKHSPIPAPPTDPSNTVETNPAARELGELLFFDPRLSGSGTVSCASCHDPALGWSDGRPVANNGRASGIRRTPSIRNVVYQRWFNWDGSADSLWSQVLGPIESTKEMHGDRRAVSALVVSAPELRGRFQAVFGEAAYAQCSAAAHPLAKGARQEVTDCFRNVGKALAAYVRTIVSRPNRFDAFVERVRRGSPVDQAGLDEQELRGLRLFFGKARCFSCHTGPLFTNGEFHNLALYPTTPGGWTDSGRLGGIEKLLASEFNQLHAPREAVPDPLVRYLTAKPGAWGQFKTPSLRNASSQTHYMHHGQFSSLMQVVRFYSDLTGVDGTDHHRELSIMPLQLTGAEQADLVRFLQLLGE